MSEWPDWLVTCRECRFAYLMDDGSLECTGYLVEPLDYRRNEANSKEVEPEDFCSWGERER